MNPKPERRPGEIDADRLDLAALDQIPVTRLNGVGDKKAKGLAATEIHTLFDLLTHYPRRYLDRTKEARIAELREGDEASVLVTVDRTTARRIRGGKVLINSTVSDASGSLRVTFFNQAWRERQLTGGRQAMIYGKVELYRGQRQMTNPVVDLVGDKTGRIIPVYPQSEKSGIQSWDVTDWVAEILRRSLPPKGRGLVDPLPMELLDRFDFIDREAAFAGIHKPDSMAEVSAARRRLVFDELFRIQLALVLRKRAIERTEVGVAHIVDGPLSKQFHAQLPFELTAAQIRAIAEIGRDLARPVPMHRLLQGDVGAGKTLVAVATMLAAVDGGHQAALMAPTEVLAEQHYAGIRHLLDGMTVSDPSSLFADRPLRVELLTNRIGAADRKRILNDLLLGTVDIAIGTHALIQDAVTFGSLGAVVIDEQHRFGVEQRAALREQSYASESPDVLVMTATPIPRTAAMTVYGDLDVSVLDELPPGRTPITTRWVQASGSLDTAPEDLEASAGLDQMWASVRDEIADGRQVYVVCPLIDESEKMEVASAESTFERLRSVELTGTRLGLLHGRLSPAEKDKTMDLFRDGHLDVLVATTVIEVGVDVPNATVMVILDADRFGIAQLHQLRGRVGRGRHTSTCWLVGEGTTDDSESRLEALVASTDGFELAEVDLDLRGEGTIMGERQKGRNDLKLASLRRDRAVVSQARNAAIELIDADPLLTDHGALASELELFLDEGDAEFLLKG
ncbi:MAG: ATP-dependent DNA helicase RecG [Actinomycetia bacterium]|nr:ATP-dependent DNA helicase RecG [Actinomycetes bacterium]MCP5031498.1 ATP-dependent DNA helicase RecG [Actinomycetes bacterium]